MTKETIKRYLPTILSFLACGGVVGTAVLAVKNHEKAKEQMIETINFYAGDNKDEPYLSTTKDADISEKEKLIIYAKAHIPTALMGIGTMACIMGSNGINHNVQAGMISAYGLLNESYKDYRNNVIETHGVKEHKRIIDSIAVEKANPPYLSSMGFVTHSQLNDADISKTQPKQLFYDEYSRRYFESTLSQVIEAEYHINRNFCLGKVVTANEWYEYLGIEQTIEGNELAWYLGTEEELFWLDFDNTLCVMPDGTEYISISMVEGPSLKWQEEEFY